MKVVALIARLQFLALSLRTRDVIQLADLPWLADVLQIKGAASRFATAGTTTLDDTLGLELSDDVTGQAPGSEAAV